MALIILLAALNLILHVDAVPVANYPINAQLPPVARVAKPFKFAFADSTFVNTTPDTTYSLSNAPAWLHIDSASRELTGTPSSQDAGPAKFDLVASDHTGSASMNVTLVVMARPGPQIGEPVLPQLETFGATSAPSTIFVYPGNPFSFSFAAATFSNTDATTIYYATSPGNAPLPSWVHFDPSTLTFSGTSPSSPSSIPQTFDFYLVASDVAGFSAATATFDLVVGVHILAFQNSSESFHLDRGKPFISPQFYDKLILDAKPVIRTDLANVTSDAPSWLTLNASSISLSGTPPDDAADTNVTISVTDIYQDVTRLLLSVNFPPSLLDGLSPCRAIVGRHFTCSLDAPRLDGAGVQLVVAIPQNVSSWMIYNPTDKTLSGQVPADSHIGNVYVNLTATQGSTTNTRRFIVSIRDADGSTNNASAASNAIHRRKAGIIAISVVIPCIALSGIVLLICCWRRKHRAAHPVKRKPGSDEKPAISRPKIPDAVQGQRFEDTVAGDRPKTSQSPAPPPSDPPPQLDLAPLWTTNPLTRTASTGNLADEENQLSQAALEWGFVPLSSTEVREEREAGGSLTAAEAPAPNTIPVRRRTTNYSRKREPFKPIQSRSLKRDSAASTRSRRNSRRSSGLCGSVAAGLPVRLSGAGHGAGGLGPPGHGIIRVSWQNTRFSLESDDGSLGNLAPLFPRPPAAVARTRDSMCSPPSKRMSLRAIEPESSIVSETDSLEAFVQRRAKHRNSNNPLFSGKLSHRHSSGYRALEKARSISSRVDTFSSFSPEVEEAHRDRPFSEISGVLPAIPASRDQSRTNLADVPDQVAPALPKFWSADSLDSRPLGPRDSVAETDDLQNLIDERADANGQRCWYEIDTQPAPATTRATATDTTTDTTEKRELVNESAPTTPVHSRVRRMSLLRSAGKESSSVSSPTTTPVNDRLWRLAENNERRSVSIEQSSSLRQELTGSVSGDLAFV